MLWIEEVETVDSVDDLKFSQSIAGHSRWPNFELLDARVASSLNKIMQNSCIEKQGQSGRTESSEVRLVSSRETDRVHDLRLLPGYLRPGHCSRLFAVTLRDGDVQEFDTKWDGILLSMSNIPTDDVSESLYNLQIRECDQFKQYWNHTSQKFVRRN